MSSPLSRIMNPYPFAALNHFTVPISLNALASFFPITYVDLRSEDRSQSREHLRSNLPNPLLPFTPTSTTAKSKLAHPTRRRYNCQHVQTKYQPNFSPFARGFFVGCPLEKSQYSVQIRRQTSAPGLAFAFTGHYYSQRMDQEIPARLAS